MHQQQQQHHARIGSPRAGHRILPPVSSGSGLLVTRMTNQNGEAVDIYENPSEHYGFAGLATGAGAPKFLPTMQPSTVSSGQYPIFRPGFLNTSMHSQGKSNGFSGFERN